MVDRVVAIVGNRPVLASQVDEEVFSRQSQGAPLPNDPDPLAALRKQVISSIVDEELLVQQAQRDTAIKVTDQEIADGVEQQVRKVRGNFTSESTTRTSSSEAGFGTPEEYRRWLTDQQRRAALQNRLIEKLKKDGKLKPVSPTEPRCGPTSIQQRAPWATAPRRSPSGRSSSRPGRRPRPRPARKAQADSIVLELRRGADFATARQAVLAGSGIQGPGRLAQLVPAGGDGAGVRAGGVRAPARAWSPIRSSRRSATTSSRSSGCSRARCRPATSCSSRPRLGPRGQRARLADSVQATRAPEARPSTRCSGRLHDPSAEKQADNVPADKLPEAYAKAFGDADSGAVAPVFSLPGAGTREQFVVAPDHRTAPPGDIRYEDVRDRIRRPARPAARHPALHRPAPQRHLRGGPVIAAAPGHHAGGSARYRARDHRRARWQSRSRRDDPGRRGGPDRGDTRRPAGGVGTWGLGSGDNGDRGRAIRAGRSPGTRWRRPPVSRSPAKWTRSSPPPLTSMRCIWRAFPFPDTPSGWRSSPAEWTWP